MPLPRTLAALFAALAVTACASGGSAPATQAAAVLRIADKGEPDTLNPLLSQQDLSYMISSLVFSYLVVADARGRLAGDLATEVPSLANGGISADGRTYTYHLRRGVRWHDGTPLTARDVRFSWQAVMNPRNDLFGRQGYEEVTAIDAPDDRTAVVHLRRRFPPFLTDFFTSLQEGAKAIVPQHVLGRYRSLNDVPFNAAPVGSGPYAFVSWRRGQRLVLAANDAYYGGRPQIRRIELSFVPSDATILTELRTGAIDMIAIPSPELIDQYRAVAGVRTTLRPWNYLQVLLLNNGRPGLADPAVRRALVRAIDVDAIIAKVTHGVGERAYDILAPGTLGYSRIPPYPYDPQAARRTLDAAGWRLGPDGVRRRGSTALAFDFAYTAGTTTGRALAVQVQQMLAAAGFAITIKPYAYNTIYAYDGPIVTHRYDIALSGFTMQFDPDQSVYLTCGALRPHGENDDQYCDPAVDAGERAGLATDDAAQRARIYASVSRRLHDTVPYVPLYLQRRIVVATGRLEGYDPPPTVGAWGGAQRWRLRPGP